MIPKLTASTIYSTLGNNSSRVPLAIKDIANSCGLTAASYMAGDSVEGKDRFIDEFGTQGIWLFGIPVYKKVLDVLMLKPMGFDNKIDARILQNQDILKAAQKFAPTQAIKNSLQYVAAHQPKFKGATFAKFALSTVLTCASYFGLTKYRHNYTEEQIKKDYFAKQNQSGKNVSFMDGKVAGNVPFSSAFSDVYVNNKQVANAKKGNNNVTFTGGLQDFIFDPVKNLMIVDATITGERLTDSRNPQDFFGYVIKEGSFWAFMYGAGPLIEKALEKHADKKGKSIDLDARVLESADLQKAIQDGSLKAHLEIFKKADVSDVDLYKFAVKPDSKNLVLDMAKKSDIITMFNDQKVDTRSYIDLEKLRGVGSKLEKLIGQYETSGETLDSFLKTVRKMKRQAVLKNIGACIGALGVIAPAIMLGVRKFGSNSDYQVKKDIEAKLAGSPNKASK